MDRKVSWNIQALETERSSLLARIEQCQRGSKETTDLQRSLVTQYNEVTNRYNTALAASHTRSPDQLPIELWIKIIKEVTFAHYGWSYEVLLLLTHVNRKWAAAILETPSLWTAIGCSAGAEDFEAVISVQLTLSAPLPLSLSSIYDPAFIEQAAPLLVPHAHRIERLELYLWHLPLSNPLFSQTNLTSLRSVRLMSGDLLAMSQFFSRHLGIELPFATSDLRRMTGHQKCWEVKDGKLTHLWLPFSEVIVQNLDFVASVAHVTITNDGNNHGDSTITIAGSPARRLGFQHLSLIEIPWGLLQSIIGRCDTRLTTLSATMSLTKLYSFFEILNGLSMLKRLTIEIPRDQVEESVLKETPVRLNLVSLSVNWVFVPIIPLPVILDITPYASWLIKRAPDLQDIHIGGSGLVEIDPTIFKSLDSLISLDLEGVKYRDTLQKGLAITSPNLRNMTLPWVPAMFAKLQSGSATHLSIDFYLLSLHADDMVTIPLVLEDEQWGALTSLTVIYRLWVPQLAFANLRLSKLRSINIGRHSVSASLYRNMAVRPDDLPSLEEMEVGTVIEWDIFMIMLERRLVAQSRGVSALRKITFRPGLPSHLRAVVTMNLRGFLVKRPSNYELSLRANCEAILDPSIPGCMTCHLQHVHCREPLVGTDSKTWMSLSRAYTSSSQYPESEADILATWEGRFRELWPIISRNTRQERVRPNTRDQLVRSMACYKNSHQVEITRYSVVAEASSEFQLY